jgi:hypothetical protein
MSERAATMDAVDCVCTALRALVCDAQRSPRLLANLGYVAATTMYNMIPCHHAWWINEIVFAPRCGR